MSELIITPKTKVLDLLDAYPQLEQIVIDYAPAFAGLKNPVLRRTVARIATLQQAAAVGNVKVEELINRLRSEVGQDLFSGDATATYATEAPDWYAEDLVESEFDASQMLDAGEQPVNQVIADLRNLSEGGFYKLQAPFLPAPLIDKASSLGLAHWLEKHSDGEFEVYFYWPPA
jgi:hypothetical protein